MNMQPRQYRKAARRVGLTLMVVFGLTGPASTEEAMKVRPGFGYTIVFMTGTAAEALLPVPRPGLMITRPGFGYTIHFTAGSNVPRLPSAPKQEAAMTRPGFGYTIDFMTGYDAEALLPVPDRKVVINQPASVTP
jgi:hypothetical protein